MARPRLPRSQHDPALVLAFRSLCGTSFESLSPELNGPSQRLGEYLSFQKDDPWIDYWKKNQTLSGAIRKLAAAKSRRSPRKAFGAAI